MFYAPKAALFLFFFLLAVGEDLPEARVAVCDDRMDVHGRYVVGQD